MVVEGGGSGFAADVWPGFRSWAGDLCFVQLQNRVKGN